MRHPRAAGDVAEVLEPVMRPAIVPLWAIAVICGILGDAGGIRKKSSKETLRL